VVVNQKTKPLFIFTGQGTGRKKKDIKEYFCVFSVYWYLITSEHGSSEPLVSPVAHREEGIHRVIGREDIGY